VNLPTWDEVVRKMDSGVTLNPLEQFIYSDEPAGEGDMEWRKMLNNVLDYVTKGDLI